MTEDILTVMWKERKGLLRVQGSLAKTVLSFAVPVLMIAILMPLQLGEDWVEAAWSLLASIIIPLILVGIVVPQAFAGERERHTLETLLASRLPDRAILFGKVLLAVAYGWGMTMAVLLVALIPVNLVHWAGRILVYRPEVALANLLVSLLMAALIANLGVLVSLRSATAQGAQQVLISLLLVPLLVLQVIPMILLSVVPNGRELLRQWLSVDLTTVVLVVIAVLVVMNASLLLAAMARFKRSRLCLD
jgi:ABC-2 type transport system permease protein